MLDINEWALVLLLLFIIGLSLLTDNIGGGTGGKGHAPPPNFQLTGALLL